MVEIAKNVNVTLQAMQAVQKEELREAKAAQQESQSAFLNQTEEMINPFAARYATRQKSISNRNPRVQKMLKSGDKADRLAPVKPLKDLAHEFQSRNPEMESDKLIALRDSVLRLIVQKPNAEVKDILAEIATFFPDLSLADEALDFLLLTTDGPLHKTIQEAKDQLHSDPNKAREIIAGHNIGTIAREASAEGLGTPSTLRDMYRSLIKNPSRDPNMAFKDLSARYPFKDLKRVIAFLLHSLGADMKSKGPSIPRGMLYDLINETRSLQAILGVYNFFRGRMNLVSMLFRKEHLDVPPQLTFEAFAKQFIDFVSERLGQTPERALQIPSRLGAGQVIDAGIIILSQIRDAVREVAITQIFKTVQHRDEISAVVIEALTELEDQKEEAEMDEVEEMDPPEVGISSVGLGFIPAGVVTRPPGVPPPAGPPGEPAPMEIDDEHGQQQEQDHKKTG